MQALGGAPKGKQLGHGDKGAQMGAASENGNNRTLSKWDVVFSSPHAEWKPLDCTDAGRFVFRWVENTSVSQMITFG